MEKLDNSQLAEKLERIAGKHAGENAAVLRAAAVRIRQIDGCTDLMVFVGGQPMNPPKEDLPHLYRKIVHFGRKAAGQLTEGEV